MDPVTFALTNTVTFGILVGGAASLLKFCVDHSPVCSPSRPCLTGAYSEARRYKSSVAEPLPDEVPAMTEATSIRMPIYTVRLDEVLPTMIPRNYGRPAHQVNAATRELMGQLEEPETVSVWDRFYEDGSG